MVYSGLKPGNILQYENGKAKWDDFGNAILSPHDNHTTYPIDMCPCRTWMYKQDHINYEKTVYMDVKYFKLYCGNINTFAVL